tara:strand:+ start:133 stop:387 length:255 start_codon:yes stop_codon:yes gene_type:complete
MKKVLIYEKAIEEPTVCPRCVKEFMERPRPFRSLIDFMEFEVGFTMLGIQVWCRRHNKNVCHIDFQNNTVAAYMDSQKDKKKVN